MQGVLAPFGETTAVTDLAPTAAQSSADVDDTSAPSPSVPADADADTFTISGTALGADVTRKDAALEWTPEALEALGPTLADDSQSERYPGDGLIVVDHGDGEADVVGELTHSSFDADAEEIEYEGELDGNDRGRHLALSIQNGELSVSPRLIHTHPDLLEADGDGVRPVDSESAERAVHLALVQSGAGGSNTVTAGPLDDKDPATDASALRHVERVTTDTKTTDMSSNNDDSDETDVQDWGAEEMAIAMGSDKSDLTSGADLDADTEMTDMMSQSASIARSAALESELAECKEREMTLDELYQSRYDVDPADYDDAESLRQDLERAREDEQR